MGISDDLTVKQWSRKRGPTQITVFLSKFPHLPRKWNGTCKVMVWKSGISSLPNLLPRRLRVSCREALLWALDVGCRGGAKAEGQECWSGMTCEDKFFLTAWTITFAWIASLLVCFFMKQLRRPAKLLQPLCTNVCCHAFCIRGMQIISNGSCWPMNFDGLNILKTQLTSTVQLFAGTNPFFYILDESGFWKDSKCTWTPPQFLKINMCCV